MSTWVSNQFIVEENGQNGAVVTAWLASRFVGGLPVAQDTVLPTGSPDAGPVTTSVDFGGPGFWSLQIPTDDDYVIATSFGGSLYYSLWTAPGGSGGGLPAWDMFGDGSPVGTVTPSQTGARYQDKTNGALYEALGATSADWVTVGGNGDNTVPGVTVTEDGQVVVVGTLNEGVSLTDEAALAGSGNQLGWVPGAADGDQTVAWQTGAIGVPNIGGIDADGNMTIAGWMTNGNTEASLHFATTDPNVGEPGVEGDVCWRTDTRTWYGCSTSGDPGTWIELSGGGAPNVGSNFYLPNSDEVVIAAISVVTQTIDSGLGIIESPLPSYVYSEPTITGTANGALEVDFYNPALNDIIAVCDLNGLPENGIYKVTTVGDGSHPFVLTRAAPFDTADGLGQNLVLGPVANLGGNFPFAMIQWDPAGAYGSDYDLGTTVPLINIFFTSQVSPNGASYAEGSDNLAISPTAHVEGTGNVVYASNGHAEGQNTVVIAQSGHAEGSDSRVLGAATSGHAEGDGAVAYLGQGAHAEAGGSFGDIGSSQFQRVVIPAQTTDATPDPTILALLGGAFNRTYIVTVRTVARRIDTPGTDSGWTSQGVARGDGSGAYTWVGGVAPVATLIAQDVAAATWAVAVDIDPSTFGIMVTVTGDVAETISWTSTVELDEVAG